MTSNQLFDIEHSTYIDTHTHTERKREREREREIEMEREMERDSNEEINVYDVVVLFPLKEKRKRSTTFYAVAPRKFLLCRHPTGA